MRTLKKSLWAVAAALALAPSVGFTMPVQCRDVCDWSEPCDTLCGERYRITTCGAERYACYDAGAKAEEPTASVTASESQRAEDSAPVCSEQHPDTVES